MVRKLFSILFWSFLAVSSLVCFVVAVVLWIVTTPFDRQRRVNHLWACTWASLYAYWYPGWKVRTIHRARIRSNTPYVLAANHTSLADIVLLFTLFKQFKWVSKRENFNLPLIGWNMWLSGYIPLVRGNAGSTQRMLERCRELLRNGMSIMMFPEGTRSKDGRVQVFKHGAFTLAKEAGAAVVPIAIHGGHALIPKHGSTFAASAELTVEVLEPIPSTSFDDATELAKFTREKIVEALVQRDSSRSFDLPVTSDPFVSGGESPG
jgi:1-acyl-sn-glycerol-3-phosphate acyltransferase